MTRSGWAIHSCLIDERRWSWFGRTFGCEVRGEMGDWLPRVHMSTPWFHFAVALAPSGRFGHVHGWYEGMSREEMLRAGIDLRWVSFRRFRRYTVDPGGRGVRTQGRGPL